MVNNFTFRVSGNRNKVKKFMNPWVRSKEVKISDGKRFRGSKMQGRMHLGDSQNMLNGSSIREMRLIQHQINGAKTFHVVNMLN